MKTHCDQCPLESLKCPFEPEHCNHSILRRDMESHKTTCVFRPYTCEYCSMVGTYLSITNNARGWKLNRPCHYDKCEHYPLECPNKCGEEGIKRKNIQTHRDACPLEPLECTLGSHPTSMGKILRKDMEKHRKEECDFRPYTCEHCGCAGTFLSITGNGRFQKQDKHHYTECSEYPLECPNSCGVNNIKRRNMKNHRDTCPLEVLECPFKYVKCNRKMQRKQMDSHRQDGMEEQLLLLANSHQELAHRNEELAKVNKDISCKCAEMYQKINELARTCRSMSAKIDTLEHYKEEQSKSHKPTRQTTLSKRTVSASNSFFSSQHDPHYSCYDDRHYSCYDDD